MLSLLPPEATLPICCESSRPTFSVTRITRCLICSSRSSIMFLSQESWITMIPISDKLISTVMMVKILFTDVLLRPKIIKFYTHPGSPAKHTKISVRPCPWRCFPVISVYFNATFRIWIFFTRIDAQNPIYIKLNYD